MARGEAGNRRGKDKGFAWIGLDNALAESFISTLKAELVSRPMSPTRQAAKRAIFEYLEAFYNARRLHSALGYTSPMDFEEGRKREASVA
jgi:putative transposase